MRWRAWCVTSSQTAELAAERSGSGEPVGARGFWRIVYRAGRDLEGRRHDEATMELDDSRHRVIEVMTR